MLIHEARGDRAAADAVIAEIDAWDTSGISLRRWAVAPAAIAIARRGDADAASRLLDRLTDTDIYRAARARGALHARRRRRRTGTRRDRSPPRRGTHAERGGLLGLPFHADRLEGRARAATGDPGARSPRWSARRPASRGSTPPGRSR